MNPRLSIFFGSLLILVAFSACKTDKPKCKFGEPKAIFSDSIPTVKKHFFTLKDGTGIEMVAFENKMLLEIEQSGCENIHQQFTFIMLGDFREATDDVWKDLAISQFNRMAALSPNLAPFQSWAQVIEKSKADIRLSEPFEVEKNYFVRIDKIVSPDKATLVVQLSQ